MKPKPDNQKIRYHRCFTLSDRTVSSAHSALHLSQIYHAEAIAAQNIDSETLEQLEWLLQLVYDTDSQTWREPTASELPVGGFEAPPGAHVQVNDVILFRGMD